MLFLFVGGTAKITVVSYHRRGGKPSKTSSSASCSRGRKKNLRNVCTRTSSSASHILLFVFDLWADVLVSFPVAITKYSDKSNLREK